MAGGGPTFRMIDHKYYYFHYCGLHNALCLSFSDIKYINIR